MTKAQPAEQILDRDFLDTRHRIIDVAAALDRIERSDTDGMVRDDPRLAQMTEAIRMLVDGKPDRAERVQMVFSDPYDPNWRAEFNA